MAPLPSPTRWVLAALALSACSSEPPTLTLGLDGESALVVLRHRERLRVHALQTAPLRAEYPSSEAPDAVYVLDYDDALGPLGLVEGPVALSDTLGLPLPMPDGIRQRVRTAAGFEDPGPLSALPADINAARLPLAGISACLAAGGCLDPRVGDRLPICKTSCAPPSPPAPVAQEARPSLAPCPAGWTPETAPTLGSTRCSPWPARVDDCASGFAQRPGEDACTPVGAACPADGWPPAPQTSSPVFYVDPGAPLGGDGSRGAPYSSLSSLPGTGEVVALLRAGDHGDIEARHVLTLVGSCAPETHLGAVRVGAGTLTVTDASLEGLVVEADAEARLRGVQVLTSTAIVVRGRLDAADLRVDSPATPSLRAEPGADVALAGARLNAGVLAHAAHLSLQGGAVVGGEMGVQAFGAATVEIEAVYLADMTGPCILATEESTVEVSSVLCERAGPPSAIAVRGGAALTGARIEVLRPFSSALSNEAGTVDVEHVLLADVGAAETAFGALVTAGGTLTLRSTLALGTRGAAVRASGRGTVATLEDFATLSSASEGVAVREGADVRLTRTLVRDANGAGLSLQGGSTVAGQDVRIQDVHGEDTGPGLGIHVENGTQVDITRLEIERVDHVGIYALDEGTRVTVRDFVLRDDRPSSLVGVEAGVAAAIEVIGFDMEAPGAVGAQARTNGRATLEAGRIAGFRTGLYADVYVRDLEARGVFVDAVEQAVDAAEAQ